MVSEANRVALQPKREVFPLTLLHILEFCIDVSLSPMGVKNCREVNKSRTKVTKSIADYGIKSGDMTL